MMFRETYLPDNKQKGFSLIEMLVVLAIIGVLVTLAIPNFSSADAQFQRQNVVRQLKIYLDRARFDSVKRNAETFDEMAKVIIHNSTSFSSVLDSNHNGRIESGETNLINISGSGGAKIVGSGLIFPITITFNHRGQASAINGSSAEMTPTFVVCGQNCTFATADRTNSNTLSISPTGTVALVETGQVFFDRPVPSQSPVPISSKINEMAQIGE